MPPRAGRAVSDGSASPARKDAKSLRIAQRGVRTTQDVKNLGLALAEDILLGKVSYKCVPAIVGSVRAALASGKYEITAAAGHEVEISNEE